MRRDPRQLVAATPKLASLPSHYLRLTEVANDARSSQADVARVIADDPALAARLLRLVNSALYRRAATIGTVTQALGMVGTSAVIDLALGSSVVKLFGRLPAELISMDAFWRHSVGCALTARALASARGEAAPERCFVAGLLHDVGRLVLFLQEPDAMREAIARSREEQLLLHQAERAVLGFDHGDVGRALAEAWSLPPALRDAIGGHHQPRAGLPIEAAVVHVADIVVNALDLGAGGGRLVPALDAATWTRLGLAPAHLAALIDEVDGQFADVVQIMLVYDYWHDGRRPA